MIKTTEAGMPLCQELEAWCKTQSLPYKRADDLAALGYLTAAQKAWVQSFRARWDAIKASEAANTPQGENEMRKCKCDNCGHVCALSALKPIQRLAERLDYPEDDPRCVVPDGECPKCGCLSYEVQAQEARRTAGAGA